MAKQKKPKWWELPEKRVYHFEDEQLRSELKDLLSDLPEDHPAVVALREDRSAITISNALNGETEGHLRAAILGKWNAWGWRLWERAKPHLTGR